MEDLSSKVAQLWTERTELKPQERERYIFRTLKEEGYPLGKILIALRQVKTGVAPVITPITGGMFEPEYIGCQRDDNGQVVDPFLLEPIPKEYLVSYASSKGQRFCFDKRSLYRQFTLSERINPFNREPYPKSLIEEVLAYGKSLQRVVRFGQQRVILEPFAPLGELIITLLESLPGSLLDNIAIVNPFYQEKSLYSYDLYATHDQIFNQDDSVVNVYPFADLLEKSELLINFFNFVKGNRSQAVYDTLYSALGSLLDLSPVIKVDDGYEFTVQPGLRVIEVVKEFYLALGSLKIIQERDLVFAQGISLSELRLMETIATQVPGEDIYHIAYPDKEFKARVLNRYVNYAFHANDRRLLDAIFAGTDAENFRFQLNNNPVTITHGNYTFQEIIDYLLKVSTEEEGIFDRRLASRLKRTTNVEFDLLTHELLRTTIISGKTVNFLKAKSILDILTEGDAVFVVKELKKFDLSTVNQEMRTRIVEIIAPGAVSYVLDFYQTGSLNKISDERIALLDDVPIFLHALNESVDKRKFVEYCINKSTKKGGKKILNYCLSILDPVLSFNATLRYADKKQFLDFLSRFASTELNQVVAGFYLPDKVNSLDEDQYKENVFLLLSDTRLTNQTLLTTEFWKSPVVLERPDIWLELKTFHQWSDVLRSLLDDKFFSPERKTFLLLAGKFSSKQANQLIQEYQSAFLYDLFLEANKRVKLPTQKEEQLSLLKAAVKKGYVHLLRELLQKAEFSLSTRLGLLTESTTKGKQSSLLPAFLASVKQEDWNLLLEDNFLEQLKLAVIPVPVLANYLFSFASEEKFETILAQVENVCLLSPLLRDAKGDSSRTQRVRNLLENAQC